MCGSMASVHRIVVHRLLSIVARRVSSVCSRVGLITPPPALFTRMSTPPNALIAASKGARRLAGGRQLGNARPRTFSRDPPLPAAGYDRVWRAAKVRGRLPLGNPPHREGRRDRQLGVGP